MKSTAGDKKFLIKLRHLNPDLADRLVGAQVCLAQSNNPMRLQQAASSIRSAMEILIHLFPGAMAKVEEVDGSIAHILDSLEASVVLKSTITSAASSLDLMQGVAQLRLLINEKKENTREIATRVLSEIDPRFQYLPLFTQDARQEAWVSSWRKLNDIVHSRDAVNDEQTVSDCLQYFEAILEAYFQPKILDSAREIDEILLRFDGTNADVLLDEAAHLLTNGATIVYFISKLNNAAWLNPLLQHGYFESGLTSQQEHLLEPMRLLARVGAQEPSLMADIIRGLGRTDSPQIKALVVECALNCSVEDLDAVTEKLIWLDIRTAHFVDFEKVLEIVERLKVSVSAKIALGFVGRIISLNPDQQNRFELVAPFPEWDYIKFIKGVSKLFGPSIELFGLLSKVLDQGLQASNANRAPDVSIFWLNSLYEYESDQESKSLRDALASLCVSQVQTKLSISPELVSDFLLILSSLESDFFERLSYFARATSAPAFLDDSWSLLFQDNATLEAGTFGDRWMMAKKLAMHVEDDKLQHLLSHLTDEVSNARISNSTYSRVLSILAETSPHVFEEPLKVHLVSHGLQRLERPELLVRTGIWSGESSPVTSAEIREMGPTEFLSYVAGYEPSDFFARGSKSAIAGELKSVLEENPNFLDGHLKDIHLQVEVFSTYLESRNLIIGKASAPEIIEWLRTISNAIGFENLPMHRIASLFRLLIATPVLETEPSLVTESKLLVSKLLKEVRPTSYVLDTEEKGSQVLQRAINDAYCIALEMAIQAVSWLCESGSPELQVEGFLEEITESLERVADKGILPSAIIGAHFTSIAKTSLAWSAQIKRALHLPKNTQAATSFMVSYLHWGRPTFSVFRNNDWILTHALRGANSTQKTPLATELQTLAAQQLCKFFIQGHVQDKDEMFKKLPQQLNRKQFSSLFQSIALAIDNTKPLDEPLLTNSIRLWALLKNLATENRFEEEFTFSDAFSNWFSIESLPEEWRLGTFREILSSGDVSLKDLYGTLECLKSLSRSHPHECLSLVFTLLLKMPHRHDLAWSMHVIYEMIDALPEQPNEPLVEMRTELESQLARLGYSRL